MSGKEGPSEGTPSENLEVARMSRTELYHIMAEMKVNHLTLVIFVYPFSFRPNISSDLSENVNQWRFVSYRR